MEKGGGTITFHPDVFGGPPDATNTIVLQYGELRITDFNDQAFHFDSITIKGPRADNPDAYHVHVVVPDDAKAIPERSSVIDIESLQTPVLKTAQGKLYVDTTHAIYDTVNLIGLHLSGGTTGNDQPEGAGIRAAGYVNLNVTDSIITNNTDAILGGGIAAYAALRNDPTGPFLGPNLTVTNSLIAGNTTRFKNDLITSQPVQDKGGGIYAGFNTTVILNNSTVTMNKADNSGGGIFFTGGMHFEAPPLIYDPFFDTYNLDPEGVWELRTTFLKVRGSEILYNTVESLDKAVPGTGGGLVIAGPTGAMIADTTFAGNFAPDKGGAVYLTDLVDPFAPQPNFKAIGTVEFIATTACDNATGYIPDESQDWIPGFGGGFAVDGTNNHYRISNSTLSGNRPVYGIGGGLWVQPGTAPYSFTEVNGDAFDVDVNERTISFKGFSVIGDPNLIPFPTFPGLTRLEIHNTTISKLEIVARRQR